MSDECPFTGKFLRSKKWIYFSCYYPVKPQCFSLNDTTKSPNGDEISIGNLKIGEKVLAIDRNDQIISTEIIAILHYDNNSESKSYK